MYLTRSQDALGVDRDGKKLPLGFWEGATENHEICEELLEELGLKLSNGSGLPTAAAGQGTADTKLIHQRYADRSNATCPNATASGHTTSSRPPWSRTATRTRRRCSGVRALASRHQRVEALSTLHRLKVPACCARACIRRIPSRACSRWFAVASANAIGTDAPALARRGATALRTPVPTSQGLRIH